MSKNNFFHVWTSYATYYFGKVNLSLIIPILIATFGMSKGELGSVATGFLFAYAAGQFIHGHISEKFNPFVYMGLGLILSSIANVFLGFAGGFFFLLFFGEMFDGFFQSMGWSSAVRSTASLYRSDNITTWLGTSYQIGNSVAWLVTGFIIEWMGWQWGFWFAAFIMFLRGITLIYTAPKVSSSKRTTVEQFIHTMNFKTMVAGVSLGLLNFVRYGIIVWIPTYLFQVFGMPIHEVGLKIFLIPIAGCLGTVAYNYFSKYITREALTSIYMSILTLVIIVFGFTQIPVWVVTALLMSSGFFLYGPHVFLVCTTPGRNIKELTTASSTGIIDGIGYVGAMLVGVIVPPLINISWKAAFASWILCTVIIIILTQILRGRQCLHPSV